MFVFQIKKLNYLVKERAQPEIFASAKRGSRSTCRVILQYIYLVLPFLACTSIRSTAEKDAGNHGYADFRGILGLHHFFNPSLLAAAVSKCYFERSCVF